MFNIARELNLWFVMEDLNHVFKRRAVEKDLSGVHDVAGLTKISSQSFARECFDCFVDISKTSGIRITENCFPNFFFCF